MFDSQPTLKGNLVYARPLQQEDFPHFFSVASDPAIWDQHPAWDRYQEPVCKKLFEESLASAGCLLISDVRTGVVIGSSRYFGYDESRSEVEIGWTFLARSHWGGPVNTELKQLMVDHAFKFVNSVVFFVGPENIRSQRAMEKLGALREAKPNDRGDVVYRIWKSDWLRT